MTSEVKIVLGVAALAIIVGLVLGIGGIKQGSSGTVSGTLLEPSYSPKLGTETPKLKLVEFADLQCPACAQVQPELKRFLADHRDQVQLVFRHFPLAQHGNAIPAALAIEAAGAQGQFWEMVNVLYAAQADWANVSNPEDKFLEAASALGLDINQFRTDLGNLEARDRIDNDQQDGETLGVNSTPTLFINGEQFDQRISYDNLVRILETTN